MNQATTQQANPGNEVHVNPVVQFAPAIIMIAIVVVVLRRRKKSTRSFEQFPEQRGAAMLKITGIFLDENGKETTRWFSVPSEEALKDVLAEKGWELVVIKSIEEVSDDGKVKPAPAVGIVQSRPEGKRISEIKATCKGCGHIFFFGKQDEAKYRSDELQNCGASMEDSGKDMMCCGGCWPAAVLPKSQMRQTIDPNRCPKCGSRAIVKERVTHFV